MKVKGYKNNENISIPEGRGEGTNYFFLDNKLMISYISMYF